MVNVMLINAVRVRVNGTVYISSSGSCPSFHWPQRFEQAGISVSVEPLKAQTLSHTVCPPDLSYLRNITENLFLTKVFKHPCTYKSECHCILVPIPCARSSRAVLISKTFLSRESRSLVWADSWLVTVSCSLLCWTQVAHMGQLLPELRRSCSTLNRRSSTLASRVVGLDGGTGHFIEPLTDMEWRMC